MALLSRIQEPLPVNLRELEEDMEEKLYKDGPGAGAKAPIMVTHFEGAMDAGSAGTLATVQLLRTLSPKRVATFDTDKLIDYRSHRPVMTVEDWVTSDVTVPEIALDLVHDDAGTPILVLHGPEPDARWESFAADVAELAHNAGVEILVSFHGIPAAVPHTRPIAVHVQSTDGDLVPEQPQMGGVLRFPAPLSSFLHHRLSQQNLHGLSLVAAVPYYMAESTFPRGGSALLSKLAEMTDLSLPIGDLERGADASADEVERVVEGNPEVGRIVRSLEEHYDAMIRGDAPFIESAEEAHDSELDSDVAEAMGEAIERYLRHQAQGAEGTVPADTDDDEGAQPRHRAPKPWEVDPEAD